jgi:hypothetical protein
MSQTRREFMKDAACAGAVVAAGTAVGIKESDASESSSQENDLRCPYFDQAMTCGGPDNNGKYKCDN